MARIPHTSAAMRNMRWWTLVLGLVAIGSAVPATAGRIQEPRSILRCETIIEREGINFANKIIWSVPRCLRALLECQVANEQPCAAALRMCPGVAEDIEDAEYRLVERVEKSCAPVAMDKIMTMLAFRDVVAGCDASTHEKFATCLAAALRSKAGQLFSKMMPAGCAQIAAGGVAGMLPAEICATTD